MISWKFEPELKTISLVYLPLVFQSFTVGYLTSEGYLKLLATQTDFYFPWPKANPVSLFQTSLTTLPYKNLFYIRTLRLRLLTKILRTY